MNLGKALAWVMIVLAAAAAVAYGCQGDWRRAVYWTGATILQAAVTV